MKISLNATFLIWTPVNAENRHLFLAQSKDSHAVNADTCLYTCNQMCAVILVGLSFSKVKIPAGDSMSMFEALQLTGQDEL